jgi:hypothetical protein
MNEITLKLTPQESNVLVQLIDLAIKAGGIQVAEAGIVLVKKIEEASGTNKNISSIED